jgi:GT2 family glycosyltransferase
MTNSAEKKNVHIVIPVYNRKETTLDCLTRLDSFGYLQRYQIVVIDDASTDGTAEAIHLAYPSVTVLTGSGDLWWTGAIVMGMKHAFQAGADYCVWLNDDCLIEAETLPSMVSFAQENPKTIVGPSCFYLKEGVWISKKSGSTGRKRFAGEVGKAVFVEALAGWCVLIPAEVFKTVGLPNMYRFPHYEADNMYVLKATRAGFKACILGDAQAKVLGELGVEHPRRKFSNYFGKNLSFKATFSALFWSKKSPYRIPSQFFYHAERYGYPLGVPLFTAKLGLWLFKWAKFQLLSQIKSDAFEAEMSS